MKDKLATSRLLSFLLVAEAKQTDRIPLPEDRFSHDEAGSSTCYTIIGLDV